MRPNILKRHLAGKCTDIGIQLETGMIGQLSVSCTCRLAQGMMCVDASGSPSANAYPRQSISATPFSNCQLSAHQTRQPREAKHSGSTLQAAALLNICINTSALEGQHWASPRSSDGATCEECADATLHHDTEDAKHHHVSPMGARNACNRLCAPGSKPCNPGLYTWKAFQLPRKLLGDPVHHDTNVPVSHILRLGAIMCQSLASLASLQTASAAAQERI